MGADTRNPLLPAPTDSEVENDSTVGPTDVATDVSRRTDQTSWSIPEDGSPLTIPTKAIKSEKSKGGKSQSQTSLLIEYFEGDKNADKSSPNSRPSVRVKVTPSAKKAKSGDAFRITEVGGTERRPSYTRRISLSKQGETRSIEANGAGAAEEGISVLEGDSLNRSEGSSNSPSKLKYIQPASDVSSLPPDSMLDNPTIEAKPVETSATRGLEKEEKTVGLEENMDTLKAPIEDRSRSVSRERIAQKVMEKLVQGSYPDKSAQEPDLENSMSRSLAQETGKGNGNGSRELSESNLKSKNRKSNTSRPDSGTESSLLRPKDEGSNVSATSKVSLNNPKLVQLVEDSIRRLILPEIQDIKRQQSMRSERSARYERGNRDSYATQDSRYTRDSMITESTNSPTDLDRRLSKSSSVPYMKSKGGVTRDVEERPTTSSGDRDRTKKSRRSSRDSTTEKSSSRRDSYESGSREHGREKRRRSKDHSSREVEGEGLTRERLRSHDSEERRERRRRRHKSHSHSDSIANADEESYEKSKVPPMPMQSEILDSDLTRTSILSADTTGASQRETKQSPSGNTPIQEVSRGLPVSTPPAESRPTTSTPTRQRDLGSPLKVRSPEPTTIKSAGSDRSIGAKARAAGLAAAGLGGAAAGLYALDKARASPKGSRSQTPVMAERAMSPSKTVQTPAATQLQPEQSSKIPPSMASEGILSPEKLRETSMPTSHRSSPSVQYPLTQKRHQGLSLEGPEDVLTQHEEPEETMLSKDRDIDTPTKERDIENFYENQHNINEQYRMSGDFDDQRESGAFEYEKSIYSRTDSLNVSPQKATADGQEVLPVEGKAQFVGTPQLAESAVASLHEFRDRSVTDSAPSDGSPNKHYSVGSYPDSLNDNRFSYQESPTREGDRDIMMGEEANSSRNRWSALRESAQALSNNSKEAIGSESPPRQSADRSIPLNEDVKMGASGVPSAHDPVPEIGHGVDSMYETQTNPSLDNRQRDSSVLEEPLGDETENRDHWPYEPTPETDKRRGFVQPASKEFNSAGNAAVMGAAATGLGIGGATAGMAYAETRDRGFVDTNSQSADSREGFNKGGATTFDQSRDSYDDKVGLPSANMKDEGYVSAAQARSISPISFSKPPPQLFDGPSADQYNSRDVSEDPFMGDKKARYLSGNSHGMSSPFYDAATGKGINNIQSQDVVALMDHLTVRDGQRNARDTEILVTLVRTASEMRNSFDEVKKFIETQNQATMSKMDVGSRALNASRSQAFTSPRPYRSTSGDESDAPTKKKNIFKRALKGLSSKSTADLTKIENMIGQLLEEMETLKATQGIQQAAIERGQSMDSYERLRAAPESGYEPEGQAGTSSTPSRSGNFSSPLSRGGQAMHSGFSARRESENRVSTVIEDDEYMDDDAGEYENNDGMLTPTQEAQQQRSVPYVTPPSNARSGPSQNEEYTPPSATKYKSGGSLWGIPRMSRWSKTTTSSAPDNRSSLGTARQERPYSEASRSGSDINVLPPDGVPYVRADDDRLRSAGSINRENEPAAPRSPSPLIPDTVASRLEDPKYQSKHNSLPLQHPQPRQGSTNRHQNYLESQVHVYGQGSDERGRISPQTDTFGSVPALSRLQPPNPNRLSAQSARTSNFSPISSEGAYSASSGIENIHQAQVQQHVSTGPPRPLKIKDDEPLVPNASAPPRPPKVLEDENTVPTTPHAASMAYRETNIVGGGVQQHRSPSPESDDLDGYGYTDDDWNALDTSIPVAHPPSPYRPGGSLAPIEERYSMEGDRSSIARTQSQRSAIASRPQSRRFSYETRDSAYEAYLSPDAAQHALASAENDTILEEAEEDRAITPQLSPRPALGARLGEAPARKITGPREMPGATGGLGGASGGLLGTRRRKPVSSSYDEDGDMW